MQTDAANGVYEAVRQCLMEMNLDAPHIGTAQWSPFRHFVRPAQHVILKPNFVKGEHPLGRPGVLSMITHASILRPLIDYVLLATCGDVRITICDAPLQSSVWDDIIEQSGTAALLQYYASRGIDIQLVDLRREVSFLNEEKVICAREVRERDPLGYVAVDLKERSALAPVLNTGPLEITDYPLRSVSEHHNAQKNEYLISRTILSADFFLCVPKLKTHKKTGISVAMKNLIGIIGDKSWIAHHRRGAPGNGGDEFPHARVVPLMQYRLWSQLKANPALAPAATMVKRLYQQVALRGKKLDEVRMDIAPDSQVFEGSWYGNDTLWRCVLDLNTILFFADKDGNLHDAPQRNYLALVDGIIAGEGEGPMQQTPRPAGMVLASTHPLACDYAAARLMGYDPMKIRTISGSFEHRAFPWINFDRDELERLLANAPDFAPPFRAPAHWRDHL